ncbi:MAG TPA: hypothetical protein VIM73_17755 [Polyangiaceae bacterium]
MRRFVSVWLASISLTACERPAPAPPAPSPVQSAPPVATAPPQEEPSLTPDTCRAKGGGVVFDKGDGSLHREGCPDGRAKLGVVQLGIEGGLCCAEPSPIEQAPTGKRAPCKLGEDQSCNENPAVSALWGRCTELGVCECKPGFELNRISGRCKPAP